MNAIPTKYSGVQFRSRLEARWAVMFDQLEWRWEYEPVDLDGYIPDFILRFPAGDVLAEIKPAFSVDRLIAQAAAKIDRSGWDSSNTNDALIVGSSWDVDGQAMNTDHPILGAIRQGCEADGVHRWDWCAAEWIRCSECDRISTYHFSMAWACFACGAGGKIYDEPPNSLLRAMWVAAGNEVQWKAKGRR